LIVNCDDYGRFDGRTAIIKSRLFPLKSSVTEKTIDAALNKLSTVGLVMPYFYDGKPILQLVTWDKHQTVRNKRSKYPAADGSETLSSAENVSLLATESNCNQLKAIASLIQSNPIQSEYEYEYEYESNARGFDDFWASYPKKRNKGDAEKAWKAIKPDLVDRVIEKLDLAKRSQDWTKDGGKYIPYPASWLRAKGWEDELEMSTSDVMAQLYAEAKAEEENDEK
jgi:hypothetical protein